jgi:hypothetical protein
MGRYTRKGKVSGEVLAVMDPPLGVRTRARTRTLALQKPSSDYLELRNRRLEKPAPPSPKPALAKTGLKKSDLVKREKRQEEEEFEDSFIGENLLEADAIDRCGFFVCFCFIICLLFKLGFFFACSVRSEIKI